MISNCKDLTIFHRQIVAHNEKWVKFIYKDVWFFGGKGASTQAGYENANDVQVRIPYYTNPNMNINNFEIGDIIVKGKVNKEITSQQDLGDYEFYNIIAKIDNQFGTEKHIHLGGK